MSRRYHDLKRRSHRRKPKRRFIIYCEGKNTEPAYFNALWRVYSRALIHVRTIAPAGVPLTIARSAVAQAKSLGLARSSRKVLDSFEESDQVWAVFDRDEHPHVKEAVQLCEQNGVGVAHSNPCFEVWLILHEQEYNKPDDRDSVCDLLAKLRPEYDKSGAKIPDCDDLVVRVEIAEERAEKLLKWRCNERDPHGNPSTTVGKLTSAIGQAAKIAI